MEGIPSTCFVGIASIVSAILLNRKTVALLEYRMEQVERKLDASNDTDRLARIETDIAVIKTSMEFLKKEAEKS